MALLDIHILAQACLYFCVFVLGFLVSVPTGLNRSSFDGNCILYASWETSSRYDSSKQMNCDFPIYYGVVGMIIMGLIAGLYYFFGLFKSIRDPSYGSKMILLPLIPLNTVLCLMTLVVACMVTVGFNQFCGSLEDKHSIKCTTLENITVRNISTGPFVSRAKTAQAGAWLGFVAYLAQTGLGVLRFKRNRASGNSDPPTNEKS